MQAELHSPTRKKFKTLTGAALSMCLTHLSNACLGGCEKSPVMMIGQAHYEDLTADKTIDVLETIKAQSQKNSNDKELN